ncbi:MAG TPA: hypothetical protein VKE96_24585 [Vicinamibacterales bacterium]|nr:hypothetical protein [Vicinamibacterales bacterium]
MHPSGHRGRDPLVLDQPGVAGVIVGARHARYLDQARRACVLALDDDDRAAVARVQFASSGPCGDVYDLERAKGGPHASIMRYTLARWLRHGRSRQRRLSGDLAAAEFSQRTGSISLA